jgi:hypothetical protein
VAAITLIVSPSLTPRAPPCRCSRRDETTLLPHFGRFVKCKSPATRNPYPAVTPLQGRSSRAPGAVVRRLPNGLARAIHTRAHKTGSGITISLAYVAAQGSDASHDRHGFRHPRLEAHHADYAIQASQASKPPNASRARSEHGPLLDPKNDYVFKRLFGENLSLLQALVEDLSFAAVSASTSGAATPPDRPPYPAHPAHPAHPLRLTEILNPEIRPKQLTGKAVALDIRARDSLGRHIHVKMQNRRDLHYGWRAVYHLARSLSSQLDRGDDYTRRHPVHALHLLNLVLLPMGLENPKESSSAARADQANLANPVNRPDPSDRTDSEHPAGLWHFLRSSAESPANQTTHASPGGYPPWR